MLCLEVYMCQQECLGISGNIVGPSYVIVYRASGVLGPCMCEWMPGASERHSTHGKGHEEGGLAYAKAGLSLRSPPGSTPQKKQSLPTLLLCALTSDFTGGCPPPPSCSL